jgi:hypothetical protein
MCVSLAKQHLGAMEWMDVWRNLIALIFPPILWWAGLDTHELATSNMS